MLDFKIGQTVQRNCIALEKLHGEVGVIEEINESDGTISVRWEDDGICSRMNPDFIDIMVPHFDENDAVI